MTIVLSTVVIVSNAMKICISVKKSMNNAKNIQNVYLKVDTITQWPIGHICTSYIHTLIVYYLFCLS